ncbi:MAG TPA: tyrosine-type recombinase/integrase [Coleofasciculaceae cyanobacterium]
MNASLSNSANSALQRPLNDEKLLAMWVHGLSPHTRRYYLRDAMLFLECTSTSLADVTLADVQQFATELANSRLAQSSQAKMLSSVKSLLSFAYKLGVTPVNVGAVLKSPSPKNALAERILPEVEVQQLLDSATNERDRLILRLLYGAALRVSELAGLKWRDVKPRGETGQVTVYGKGGKTRAVLLTLSLWQDLMKLKDDASWNDPVFKSRKGGHLTTTQVRRIVKAAAIRSPIEPDVARQVSPHWLRHAHASHSLDKGAPLHLVQATLGHTSISATSIYLHVHPMDSTCRFITT